MAKIELVGQAGEEQQSESNLNAFLVQTRIDIASQVLAQLVPIQVMQASAAEAAKDHKRRKREDPFGVGVNDDQDDSDDVSAVPRRVPIDLRMPVNVAIHAAEALMVGLGLIPPPTGQEPPTG